MGSEELERVFAILEEDGIRVVRKPDRKHPFFITERALPGWAKEIVIWPAKASSIGTLATAVSLSSLEWGPHLSRYSGAAFYALVHDGTESGMAVRRVTAFQGLFSSESHHFVLAEPKINLKAIGGLKFHLWGWLASHAEGNGIGALRIEVRGSELAPAAPQAGKIFARHNADFERVFGNRAGWELKRVRKKKEQYGTWFSRTATRK